jgi:endoglucanase
MRKLLRKNMRGRVLAIILAFLMIFMLSAPDSTVSASAATVTPVAMHGRLSVKGSDIIDSKGNKFQLRGISTHGINWDVGYPYVNKAAFKTLRDDWGANAVRIAMYTSEYNGYCSGGNKAALRQLIYKGVKYATDLGMYVIIDWHILNDGNPMSQLAQAKSFFATMANKYKGQNNIIYEICNEPNGCSWSTIKSYARQVIKVIRKYDKKAIIAVGTPTWSQLGSDGTHNEVADSPITGYKNIVYSLHFYANEWSHNEYLPAKLTYARKKGIAVMVTEFGMSAASGGGGISTQNTTLWLKRLNAANVSYFCWSLSNKNESCSLLSPNTKKTSGWKTTDLSAAGRYIRLKYRARKKALGNRA